MSKRGARPSRLAASFSTRAAVMRTTGAAEGNTTKNTSTSSSSRNDVHIGRDSHFKMLQSDSKYGMLMWQSKLQDRFLQEQKEKKAQELQTTGRRRSEEEHTRNTNSKRGSNEGESSESESRTFYVHEPDTSTSELQPRIRHFHQGSSELIDSSKVKFTTPPTTRQVSGSGGEVKSGRERLVPISREGEEGTSSILVRHNNINPRSDSSQQPVTNFPEGAPNVEGNNFPDKITTSNKLSGTPNREDYYDYKDAPASSSKFMSNDAYTFTSSDPTRSGNDASGAIDHNNLYKSSDYYTVRGASTSDPRVLGRFYEEQLGSTNTGESGGNNATVLPKIVSTGASVSSNVSSPQKSFDAFSSNMAFFGLGGFGTGLGSGAGAPRRSPSGRVITNLQGHPDIRYHQKDTRGFDQTLRYMMDKERVVKYREDLDRQVMENGRAKLMLRNNNSSSHYHQSVSGPIKIMSSHESNSMTQQQQQRRESGGESSSGRNNGYGPFNESSANRRGARNSNNGIELAPLIRKYKSLPKLSSYLHSTDVTKAFVTSPRRNDYCLSPEPEEVARDLSMQLAEKHRIQQVSEERERMDAEKHFSTWDSFWGRPGGGAPMYSRRIGASIPNLMTSRSDLFKSLHMSHKKV